MCKTREPHSVRHTSSLTILTEHGAWCLPGTTLCAGERDIQRTKSLPTQGSCPREQREIAQIYKEMYRL